ncbi:ABC transporter substrate-binding protein [Tabrizicola soli]|uniref:ABC transporter substrate-binding protein n=1 Tax=Tabrizicola soli TaxID=2185115 RepID=A0ABV7DYT5_9RHOB|nr:ABC transporter substrate-binding protein [Tabrizicola soli]
MSKYRFGADLAVSASLPKHAVRAREAVKVGVLAPLTGDASAWGRPGFEGCQIWADWVNAEGGLRIGDQRRRVEIVAFDDQYDPARAVLGAKHLVLDQEVKIILMLGGDTVPAIGDFLTRSRMLATTLLPSDLSPDTPYLIAPCEVHPIYVVTGVDWLAENRPELRRVALCAQRDAHGLPSLATYRAAFEAAGMSVVKEILYTGAPEDSDAMVDAMLAAGPDILCWDTAYEPFVHALTEAAWRKGFKGQILSCTCDNYPALIERTSREFMEGFLFHFPDFDDPALNAAGMGFPRPAEFYAEFNRRFPGEWSTVSWEYYAILDMWRKAVERVQTVEPMVVLSAMKLGGIGGNVFGEARWWGRELFGIDHALVGSWPVVRICDGRARIVEFRSVLNWCEEHGDLLLAHMRACGQMWYQRLERQVSGTATPEDQAPRTRS